MMKSLNTDQFSALQILKPWHFSEVQNLVLAGSGGVGKSFLVNFFIKELQRIDNEVNPILIAPTHEALKNLKEKVPGDFIFRTIHSALGIAPTDKEKELKFEQLALPNFWEKINLIIVDEASMVDLPIHDLLVNLGIKILWCGDKKQLPPVVINRKTTDLCISPVFEQSYKEITLTIPQRNVGAIWDFCNILRLQIDLKETYPVPTNFDVSLAALDAFINLELESFIEGTSKIIAWSNKAVDAYNTKIRRRIFKEQAKLHKYLPRDKIILVKPYILVKDICFNNDELLKQLTGNKEIPVYFYSNTKATVVSCEEITIWLNPQLLIPTYKLDVIIDGEAETIYEPMFDGDHERIATYYEHLAWNQPDRKSKQRAFKERNFIRSCFAHVKHYYAATAHRTQGVTIDNVCIIYADIVKNPNPVERKKCLYTACARAKEKLLIYRGINI